MFYILHLSDIHFGTKGNNASKRLPQLIRAIASRTNKNSDILLALTGDVAQSGIKEQYEEAAKFVSAIMERLKERSCNVSVAIAPGNHDCNLKIAEKDRAPLLEVRQLPVSLPDLETLALPQASFWEFVHSTAVPSARDHSTSKYEFVSQDSESIFVQTINTALYSRLSQGPGTLFIPTEKPTNSAPESALHITLMHHPVSWLDPRQANGVRETLAESTDIILTGHEHAGFAQELANLDTNANQLHIEGIALQGEQADDSGFYIIGVDIGARRYSTIRFAWRGERYEAVSDSDARPFQCNRRRSRNYSFTKEHHEFLNDLGVAIGRPQGESLLSLDDVYVYPDLQEPTDQKNGMKVIKGEDLVSLISGCDFTVVTGPEQSGKTCFARRLCRDLAGKGFWPVYFDAVPRSPLERKHIVKQYSSQYSFPDSEAFAQADSERRVVILDDSYLHDPVGLEKSLKSIRDFADHVVLFTSETFHQIASTIVAGAEVSSARVLRMLPFGHARRGQLVDRWLAVASSVDEAAVSGAAYERDHLQRMQFLTNVVGKNLVPAFPVVLLSLLKANEQNQQPDLTRSGFSYYYDLLIRQQLALGSAKPRDIDLKTSFLSELALELFRRNIREISDGDLRAFTEKFEKEKILQIDYSTTVQGLVKSKLLTRTEDDRFVFAYDWARYYFVARQMAAMLGLDALVGEAKTLIRKLQGSIDSEESGNILLFLAYFSKHQFLFDSLCEQADAMYAQEAEFGVGYDAELKGDVGVAEALKLLAPEFQEGEGTRAQWLAQRDQQQDREKYEASRRKDVEADFAAAMKIAADFYASERVVQLLGQLLKNNPASIPGDQKLLVAKSCYKLAFRTLGFHSKLVKEYRQALVQSYLAPIVSDGHVPSLERLEEQARESLHVLRYLATQSTIRRVANALADFALVPLAERLAGEIKTPASELVSVAVRLSLLESTFPRTPVTATYERLATNPMGQMILRRFVATRLYLYDTGHEERQRICSHLEISVKSLPQPRRKQE